ncbi:bifunctional phosphoribosylaminoimidazole carboxylase/phosphoribosylaminoimidazole succinocarboxamide synthetase isoform X2 [Gasterosteus aculeatus]
MERGAKRQRGGRSGEGAGGSAERRWGEAEELALVAAWDEAGGRRADTRATFEAISGRLRRLSVERGWWECRAKCRRLGLCVPAAGEGREEEEEGEEGSHRGSFPPSGPMQEGPRGPAHRGPAFAAAAGPAEEGGRHWTDDEVRALLCVWADRRVRERLKCTLRNKSIFQEMARRMQRSFGVVRNWKQCRTKYKNLKYDYKTAKGGHAAGGGAPGKYMKFFDEVEAILLDRGLGDGTAEMQRRLYEGGGGAGEESEVVIEIEDDDHSDGDDMDQDLEAKWGGADAPLTPCDPSGSEQFHVVTVADTGRNWSDQEVRALIRVWSDQRVCRQLESSTRKRDIFVQISNRLMQQGVERDWKQCHTKYKNLKYLYRSLQRGRSDEADPRRLMRFYDEVDAIMNRPADGSPCRGGEESERDTQTNGPSEMERATHDPTDTDSASSVSLGVAPVPELRSDRITSSSSETRVKREELPPASRRKRKAADEDLPLQTPPKKVDCETAECKEEPDHIPIIKIDSVRSMPSPAPPPDREEVRARHNSTMTSAAELKLGEKLNEGKTKQIFLLEDQPGLVLVQSKDQITAGNAVRKDQMEGKAAIANGTASCVFRLLQDSGIKTAFVKRHSDTAFIATHCEMIPIEWVCRRVATGSFLKRNPGVKEGYRFSPLKLEMFFKDDANNDPQWSEEQLLEAKFSPAGLAIGQCEVDVMSRSTVAIFEILEKSWATQDCTLVDMKIEFGVNVKTQEIVLADVIDNDSWRLWPAGDRSQQKDKQVYRDLKEVTPEAMQMVKRNFEWVSERVKLLLEPRAGGRVVVLMGSTSDLAHCEKIRKACTSYGVRCILRVTSAHKGPDETLRIKAEYEGDGVPTVFVAVAGRSNGLGPVMSGNTAYPVINCPPLTPDWGAQDVWSSLRMPSGLGCSTVLSPDAAAQFAAQIFGLTDHLVWCRLRASMLNTWVALKLADQKLQACSL